ncbi:MAG: alpha-ketoacid dehydrogenase subunit beta [Firmicutes bacterium]|nr:alpha-ketoacid dehydrogenase subunit beta [Alicyclobacillaceae bacterium]MCL6498094.1 alpha-ketoacid dehydrogenase subunit beta [Bacillota bacterium]
MAEINMVTAINQALAELLASDPRVVLLGEDIGVNGGVFRVTEGLYERFGRDRVMDTPLAESGILGAAIGMAVGGLRPIAEIQFMGFLYPGLDQLISHAGRIRHRSLGALSVPMVVRIPYGGGIRAPEQHADSAEAYLVHTPGLKVVVPSTPYDAKGLLYAALAQDSPVAFLEPIRLYRLGRMEVPEGPYQVPIGPSRVAREGRDLSLFAWGAMVPLALACAEEIAREDGAEVEVVDLRTLAPVDVEGIGRSVRKTGRAVVVHEAPMTGGVGAEVVATINETAFWWLKAPVARVTGFDLPYPPYAWEEFYLPGSKRLLKALRETLRE